MLDLLNKAAQLLVGAALLVYLVVKLTFGLYAGIVG